MFIKVLFNININEAFTYIKPSVIKNSIKFRRVLVPFNKKLKVGFVSEEFPTEDKALKFKLENVVDVIDSFPLISETDFQFLQWMSKYYIVPLGQIIFNALPSYSLENFKIKVSNKFSNNIKLDGDKQTLIDLLNSNSSVKKIQSNVPFFYANLASLIEKNIITIEKHTPKSRNIKFVKLENIENEDIKSLFGNSTLIPLKTFKKSVGRKFNKLLKNNEISIIEKNSNLLPSTYDSSFLYQKPLKLTEEQAKVWAAIKDDISKNKFATHLIFGVTGSGKTEIYIKAIEETLKAGKSVIYMVPEISLTTNIAYILLTSFLDYEIAVYHSKITKNLRYNLWEKIKKGKIKIVVGARSSLFAPVEDLGLIIVDEEHEYSYKQEDKPRYHGRDSAIMKGKLHNAVVLLGSATPSVNSYYNALTKKYKLGVLKKRVHNFPMPEIEIIDLKPFKDNLIITPPLKKEIQIALKKREQVILLINKKGYSSYLLCKECGYVFKCKNCDITLTYYKSINKLLCSLCDNRYPTPSKCPQCGGNMFKSIGKGTEKITEQVMDELKGARVKRFDAQSTSKKGSGTSILREFNNGEIDIIVGTQMIAKGYDFKNVSLVGIITIDNMLNFPDFNSVEKTFQLIIQCAGRAGRSNIKGKVMLQTFSPDNYIFKFCKTYNLTGFYKYELMQRKVAGYPPFLSIVHIIIESNNKKYLENYSEKAYEILNIGKPESVVLLGPVPSQVKKIRNRYRYSILLKGKSRATLNKLCVNLLESFKKVSAVTIKIDVDPVSLM